MSKLAPEAADLQWMQTQTVSLWKTRAALTKMSWKKMFHGLCLVYFIFRWVTFTDTAEVF